MGPTPIRGEVSERFLPLTDLAFQLLMELSGGSTHGYALVQELRRATGRGGLRTGTVYAALTRLRDDGLVAEVDAPPGDSDPRRRYYGVTDLGSEVARAEAHRLRELLARATERNLLTQEV